MSEVIEDIGCFVNCRCCIECDWFQQPPRGYCMPVPPREICPKCGGGLKTVVGQFEYETTTKWLHRPKVKITGFIRKA